MKTNKVRTRKIGRIYSMLARSVDNKRGYFETIVYALVALATVAAIMQFNLQPDPLPLIALPG